MRQRNAGKFSRPRPPPLLNVLSSFSPLTPPNSCSSDLTDPSFVSLLTLQLLCTTLLLHTLSVRRHLHLVSSSAYHRSPFFRSRRGPRRISPTQRAQYPCCLISKHGRIYARADLRHHFRNHQQVRRPMDSWSPSLRIASLTSSQVHGTAACWDGCFWACLVWQNPLERWDLAE